MFKLLLLGVITLVTSKIEMNGQVLTPVPTTNTTVNSSNLPSVTIGFGPSWSRGSSYPLEGDINLGLHIGSSNWYSWSTMSTPIATKPLTSNTPLASTITTGGAWVAAQSKDNKFSIILIMQIGFTSVQATSTTAPSFNGSFGVGWKVWKDKSFYLIPYFKASNPVLNSNGTNVTSFVAQPGVMGVWGFGGK